MIVVDASVALAWCLSDEADEYAERMLERVAAESAAAPAHWPLEVANAIRSAERRGRIDEDEASLVGQMLDGLGIEVVPIELTTALWTVLDISRENELSAYDAGYVVLLATAASPWRHSTTPFATPASGPAWRSPPRPLALSEQGRRNATTRGYGRGLSLACGRLAAWILRSRRR